jgi:hypothetical protein
MVGENEHGCCCAADLQSTAAPGAKSARKGLPSNSTRPRPPPVNVSSPMHTMYAIGKTVTDSLETESFAASEHPAVSPDQAIGPRGAAALDLTSPLSFQYCRRAR